MLSRPKLHRLWTTLAFSISGKSPCSFWKRHYEVLFTWLWGLACAVSTCIAYAERLLAASVQDLANKRLDLVNRWKKDGANRECFKLVDLAEFLSQDRTIRHCNSSSDPSRTRKIQSSRSPFNWGHRLFGEMHFHGKVSWWYYKYIRSSRVETLFPIKINHVCWSHPLLWHPSFAASRVRMISRRKRVVHGRPVMSTLR